MPGTKPTEPLGLYQEVCLYQLHQGAKKGYCIPINNYQTVNFLLASDSEPAFYVDVRRTLIAGLLSLTTKRSISWRSQMDIIFAMHAQLWIPAIAFYLFYTILSPLPKRKH